MAPTVFISEMTASPPPSGFFCGEGSDGEGPLHLRSISAHSPTTAYTPLSAARLRALMPFSVGVDHCSGGGGGGPLRTRRRLTRAQRRPQERRSDRRGTAWLQRATSRHLRPQEQGLVQGRQTEVHLSRNSLYSGSSSSGEETGDAGAGPSGTRTHYTSGERCVRLLQDGDKASLAASVVVDVTPPPSPPDGAPSPSPIASSSPPPCPVPAPASAPSSKDALQQRLLLLRRRDGLIDITIRTMKLMRRNQQLQHRLMALQAETRAFVRSVLSNPENRGLHLTPSSPQSSPALSPLSSPALSPSPSSPCPALTLSRP